MKSSMLLLICNFTFLWVLVTSQNKTRNIPGVGELTFIKKGAGVVLRRKGGKLELRVTKLQIDELRVKQQHMKNIDFEVLKDVNDTTYGIKGNHMEVKGTAPNGATMEMGLFMFLDNGTITGDDGMDYDVQKGSLKFNLKFNWPEETNQTYAQLAFRCGVGKRREAKRVKGKGKKAASAKRNLEGISPCEKARITFSPLFKEANSWKEMAEGYPKIEEGNEGWTFVMLKFSGKSIVYDPVADVGDDIATQLSQEIGSSGSLIEMSWIMVTFATFMGIIQAILF